MTIAIPFGISGSPVLDPLEALGDVHFSRIITFAGQAAGGSCVSVTVIDAGGVAALEVSE